MTRAYLLARGGESVARVDHHRIQKMYGQAVEVYLLIRQPARSVVHLRLVAGLL